MLVVGLLSWLDDVKKNFAFVGADFDAETNSSFLQSFNELLGRGRVLHFHYLPVDR